MKVYTLAHKIHVAPIQTTITCTTINYTTQEFNSDLNVTLSFPTNKKIHNSCTVSFLQKTSSHTNTIYTMWNNCSGRSNFFHPYYIHTHTESTKV